MANLRTAMDSAFWDLNVSSPRLLEGSARAVPGESFPMDASRASRALRIQQLSLLGNGFPLGIIPSYGPPPHKDLGFLALQTLLFRLQTSRWWLGLTGELRPKKLISALKADFSGSDDMGFPGFKAVAKRFVDKSLYAFGLTSQLALTPLLSILLSTEGHGEKKGRRHRMMLLQKLPLHDLTLEAAWPELFVDHKGRYWDVPESISLDLSSLVSDTGFRYRFGLHKNSGHPQALNATDCEVPLSILPGLCAKAAFSYEKKWDFWREKEKKEDFMVQTDKGQFWRPSYDLRLREPHSAISGIIGGVCAAWFGGREGSAVAISTGDNYIPTNSKKRSPLSADLFGSICYTFQHGQFRRLFGDLTRIDARLDMCSASAFGTRILKGLKRSSVDGTENPASSPRLNLTFQQQVVGPIVFRVDSRVLVDYSSGRGGPHVEDFIYSLTYSLRLLKSGKVVAWFSPKRKEGMIELRLFEF